MTDKQKTALKELCGEIWQTEESLGWHDEPETIADRLQNITGEISEIWDEHRHFKGLNDVYYECTKGGDKNMPCYNCQTGPCQHRKPCGIPSEFADIIIWVIDYCWNEDIDIIAALEEKMKFNATRPYRHGKKI